MAGEGVELIVSPRQYKHVITPQGQNFDAASLPGVTSTPQYVKEEVKEKLVDDIRKKVGAKMNKETLLCGIDKFLGYYGPRKAKEITEKYVMDCREHLIDCGLLIYSDQNKLYWRDFKHGPTKTDGAETEKDGAEPEKDDAKPKKKVTENAAFANLKHIIKAIDEFVGNDKGHNYVFRLVPNQHLTSEIADAEHKMDGALVDKAWDTKGKLPVCFIYKPHEYKMGKTMEDKVKNRLQTAGDCHCIMNEDPRRMHVYAISMEGDRLSVWYFSRSHSMKSLAFDWIGKDIDKCIRVFLSFALATPKELGIDPTVTLAPRDTAAADQHYIYRCPVVPLSTNGKDAAKPAAPVTEFKYFKTVRIIKEMRPYNIAGRNTRIWKVVEVKGPNTNEVVSKEEFVLKDVWLEDTRKTEAENLDLIFKTLEELVDKSKKKWGDNWKKNLFDKDDRFTEFDEATKDELRYLLTDQKYKSLFLTKLHAWKGETSLDVCESAMHSPKETPIFQGDAVVTDGPTQSAARTQANPGLESSSRAAKKQKQKQENRRPFAKKTQSRFIYKEVCSDLDTVGTLGNVMDLISQALKALRILFCAGWVHRDISSNNILAFKDNGKWTVKLADLEFSQTLDHGPAQADPRTGTPYFMPIEISTGKYLLPVSNIRASYDMPPALTMAGQLRLEEGTAEYDIMKRYIQIGHHQGLPSDADLDAIPKPKTVVRPNFQHDLESIWWIIVYFITARIDHEPSQEEAENIFEHTLPASTQRTNTFNNVVDEDSDLGACLHEDLDGSFVRFIEDLRSKLRTEYLVREVLGQMRVPRTYAAIHATFAKKFADLLANNTSEWRELPVLPASAFLKTKAPALVPGTKRGHEDDEEEGEGEELAAPPKNKKRK